MMELIRFAITYTVKNECDLLLKSIHYHYTAGCTKFYVFLDGTTDDTYELLKELEYVEIFQTQKPENLNDLPQWIINILDWWERDMDVRKRINTYYAANLAFNEGITWLGCIDPDELIIPNKELKNIDNRLINEFLKNIPEKCNQVLMRNLEVVTTKAETDNPFLECVLFLNRFPVTETIWRYSSALVRRLFKSKIQAWFDYIFYKIRFANLLQRLMVNPITNEKIPGSYFLGYSNHKSFVRTKHFNDFNFVTHKWIKYTSKPQNTYLGFVLHYDLYDYKYFSHKFKQRQESMLLKVFYFRYMIAKVAREVDIEGIKSFFLKYIAITDDQRISKLENRNILVRITAISDFFRK